MQLQSQSTSRYATWVFRALFLVALVLFIATLYNGKASIDLTPIESPSAQKAIESSGIVPSRSLESTNAYSRFQAKLESRRLPNTIYPSTLSDQEFIQYTRLVIGLRDLNDFLESTRKSDLAEDDIIAHTLRYMRSLELAAHKSVKRNSLRAEKLITELRDRLRNALYKNQNPSKCSEVQAIQCQVSGRKGFASAFGEMTHCLASGLMVNRTVIFVFNQWVYADHKLWSELFEPLGNCTEGDVRPPIDTTYPKHWAYERKDMTRIPDVIAKDLVAHHGDPLAWFHGQLASYILRPSRRFQKELDQRVVAVDGDRDYAGLHIRRTDKGSEALLRDTEYYMRYVEEYYRRESLRRNVRTRKVYVATDDPNVVMELEKLYPDFNFFSHSEAIEQANDVPSRASHGALRNVMIDLFVLSRSQYFSCALSSGFARVTYSLMQYEYSDAWSRIASVDVPFFYAFAYEPDRIPVEPVEDLVLPGELGFVEPAEETDSETAYFQARSYYFAWAKTKLAPDGTFPTHDGSNVQAKFKTEQPFRTGTYGVRIDPLPRSPQPQAKEGNENL